VIVAEVLACAFGYFGLQMLIQFWAAHRNCDIGRDNHIMSAFIFMKKFSLPRWLKCLRCADPVILCCCARMHFPGMVEWFLNHLECDLDAIREQNIAFNLHSSVQTIPSATQII